MDRWRAQVVRLGAELGPVPADDLLPTPATVLATVAVERTGAEPHVPPDVAAAVVALHRVLGRTPRPWCGPGLDGALGGLDPTWAPAQAVRLAAAMAAGLGSGHLHPGRPWALHVVDRVGGAGPALIPVLDLLGGLLDGWDLTLAPPSVTTNVGSARRSGPGYLASSVRLATVPDLWIELDPRPGAASARGRDAASIVVRPAPALTADPGIPPGRDLPPRPAPALAAVARWCFAPASAERVGPAEAHRWAAGLLEGRAFRPASVAPGASAGSPWRYGPAPGEPQWAREEADLLLAAAPADPAVWCRRAVVEARHPAGSRRRHARLVEGAVATGQADAALLDHVGRLREAGRAAWALDVWAVAEGSLRTRLAADVLRAPDGRAPGELALTLAARVEAAASALGALVPRQTRR